MKTSNRLQKIEIAFAVILVLILSAFILNNPSITGYLSTDFVMQDINLTLTRSQNFIIVSTNPKPATLTSFKLSGTIESNGKIEVYLDNNQGQRLLVYRNVKEKKKGMDVITGFFIAGEKQTETEKAEQGSYLTLIPGNIIQETEMLELSETEETIEGIFTNECADTCFIKMELSNETAYRLIFKIEPGTILKIDNIIYTIQTE